MWATCVAFSSRQLYQKLEHLSQWSLYPTPLLSPSSTASGLCHVRIHNGNTERRGSSCRRYCRCVAAPYDGVYLGLALPVIIPRSIRWGTSWCTNSCLPNPLICSMYLYNNYIERVGKKCNEYIFLRICLIKRKTPYSDISIDNVIYIVKICSDTVNFPHTNIWFVFNINERNRENGN